MNKEDTKRIKKLEADVVKLTKTLDTTLTNQERFATALENILDYMGDHKMKLKSYRPNKLDG